MNTLIFINIVTFLLVTLKYQYYNSENTIGKSLENEGNINISLDIRTQRLLSKHEKQNELRNATFQYTTHGNRNNDKLVNKRDDNNTYEKVKRAKPNNMEAYLSSYKYRHSKKGCLKKLDCYYEKKFLNSLDKIEKIAKKKNNGKSRIISFICGKYGLPLFLLSLVPLFALIIPVKQIGKRHIEWKYTELFSNNKGVKKILGYGYSECGFEPITDNYTIYIFLFISIIIIISFIIYNYLKVMKYHRIKDGMSK